jgi:hypothetical protein
MAETTLAQRQAAMRERIKKGYTVGAENRAVNTTEERRISDNGTAEPPMRSFEELVKCIRRLEGSRQSTISRQDLYDLVWVAPLVNIAKRFGISDVGLAKICRSYHIPLPGRGYWAKLEAGQTLPRPALPVTGESWMERIDFNGSFKPASEVDASEIPEVREELLTSNKITVPEVTAELHPIVASAQRALSRMKAKPDGFLCPPAGTLGLHVSPKELPRAIAIANALISALDARGYTVSISKKASDKTGERCYWDRFANWEPGTSVRILILGEQFGFGLSELTDKVPHVSTRDEQRRIDRGDRYGIPVNDHVPSGNLSLWLNMPMDLGLRGTWSDGKKQRVEHCLNNFVITLIKAAHAIKVARAKEQHEREQRAAEEKRRAEYQEWRYEEEKRIRRLDEQLTAWSRAEQVREYAAAVDASVARAQGAIDATSEVGKWVAWMRDYARRLDPSGREDIGRDRQYW